MTTLVNFAQELRVLKNSVYETLMDLRERRNTQIVHGIDYAMFAGYIWQSESAKKVDKAKIFGTDLDFIGYEFIRILGRSDVDLPFKSAITAPTLYEFANGALRQANLLEDHARNVDDGRYDQIMQLLESESNFLSHAEMNRSVHDLFDLLPDVLHTDELNNFVKLVSERKLVSAATYLTEDGLSRSGKEIRALRYQIADWLKKSRPRRPGEDPVNYEFRISVDARNLAFAQFLHTAREDVNYSFATPFPQKRSDFKRYEDLRRVKRHPASLFLNAKVIEFHREDDDVTEETEAYLEEMLIKCSNCLKIVQSCSKIEEMRAAKRAELSNFYEDFVAPLVNGSPNGERRRDAMRRAKDIFSSKEAFRTRLESARSNLRQRAKDILEIRPNIVSDELIDEYDMDDDPRVQQIRKDLNLD